MLRRIVAIAVIEVVDFGLSPATHTGCQGDLSRGNFCYGGMAFPYTTAPSNSDRMNR
jgi:hypothetical protein